MHSLVSASLVGAALAATSTSSGNGNVANQCVNACSPILSVSADCGLPVPTNYADALNPNYWGNSAWGNLFGAWGGGNGWGLGTGTGTTAGTGTTGTGTGWAGGLPGNFPFGWFGFKQKRQNYPANGVPVNGFGTLNPAGFLSTSAVSCVCNSNAYNIQDVGSQCSSCLSSVSISNPFVNAFATQCGFASGSTSGSTNGLLSPWKREAASQDSQAKYGGGYAGWSYPSTDDGGAVVAPAAPIVPPVTGGGSGGGSGGNSGAGAGSGGGSGGGLGGALPIFSGAPKTSLGIFGMAFLGAAAAGTGYLLM